MSWPAWKAAGAALLTGLIAAGCGTQARWVNCERRLEPINVPAPKAADELGHEKPANVDPATP